MTESHTAEVTLACRNLMGQLIRPQTPGEWYAVLEVFNILKILGKDTAPDHDRMEQIKRYYQAHRSSS